MLLDKKALKKTHIFISGKDKEMCGAMDSKFSPKGSKHRPEAITHLRKWYKVQLQCFAFLSLNSQIALTRCRLTEVMSCQVKSTYAMTRNVNFR